MSQQTEFKYDILNQTGQTIYFAVGKDRPRDLVLMSADFIAERLKEKLPSLYHASLPNGKIMQIKSACSKLVFVGTREIEGKTSLIDGHTQLTISKKCLN